MLFLCFFSSSFHCFVDNTVRCLFQSFFVLLFVRQKVETDIVYMDMKYIENYLCLLCGMGFYFDSLFVLVLFH